MRFKIFSQKNSSFTTLLTVTCAGRFTFNRTIFRTAIILGIVVIHDNIFTKRAVHPEFMVLLYVRAALHLEAWPIPLEANGMKSQSLLGWRLVSTTHYDKIITGANFFMCEGLRAKKPGRLKIPSIIQQI
jgi:hypothetical protein